MKANVQSHKQHQSCWSLWIQHRKHESQADLLILECPLLPLVFELKTPRDGYHLRRAGCRPLGGDLLGLCE